MVSELEGEKKQLENSISSMKIKSDQAQRRNAELRASEEKKHAEEIVFLKKTSAQLKVGDDLIIFHPLHELIDKIILSNILS